MLQRTRVRTRNVLLSSLNEADASLLAPHLEAMNLPEHFALEKRGRPIEFAYFLDEGVACVVADPRSAHAVEIGMIGREGVVGVGSVMGTSRAAYETHMRVAGAGRRIDADLLQHAMGQSATLRACILRFAHAFLLQIMSTARANARKTLDERLARALLMLHDRVGGDEIKLTHDRLSAVLGVRRAGVSVAAKKLELAGVIAMHRGAVIVTDREGLEARCNGAYGALERQAFETPGAPVQQQEGVSARAPASSAESAVAEGGAA